MSIRTCSIMISTPSEGRIGKMPLVISSAKNNKAIKKDQLIKKAGIFYEVTVRYDGLSLSLHKLFYEFESLHENLLLCGIKEELIQAEFPHRYKASVFGHGLIESSPETRSMNLELWMRALLANYDNLPLLAQSLISDFYSKVQGMYLGDQHRSIKNQIFPHLRLAKEIEAIRPQPVRMAWEQQIIETSYALPQLSSQEIEQLLTEKSINQYLTLILRSQPDETYQLIIRIKDSESLRLYRLRDGLEIIPEHIILINLRKFEALVAELEQIGLYTANRIGHVQSASSLLFPPKILTVDYPFISDTQHVTKALQRSRDALLVPWLVEILQEYPCIPTLMQERIKSFLNLQDEYENSRVYVSMLNESFLSECEERGHQSVGDERKTEDSSELLKAPILQKFLLGKFHDPSLSVQLKQHIPKLSIVLYVSSATIEDSYDERRVLNEKVVPALRQKYRSEQISFQVIDHYDGYDRKKDYPALLARGLKGSDITDRQQSIDYSHRSNDAANKFFFLSFYKDRSPGYVFLPKYLPESDFEALLRNSAKGNRTILKEVADWYEKDDNNLIPRAELHPWNDRKCDLKSYLEVIVPALRQLLSEIEIDAKTGLTVKKCETLNKWENIYAFTLDERKCVWINREEGEGDELSRFLDEKTRHHNNVHRIAKDEEDHSTYFLKLQEVLFTRCCQEVDRVLFQKQQWNKDSNGLGIPGIFMTEMLHHHCLAAEKAAEFIGRYDLLEQCLRLIQYSNSRLSNSRSISSYQIAISSNKRQSYRENDLRRVHLALIGESGSGKSCLMAKLASIVYKDTYELKSSSPISAFSAKSIPVIVRFCGSSSLSLHAKDLLLTICLQILFVYQDWSELSELLRNASQFSYAEMVKCSVDILAKYPVFLFLDSLHALSNQDKARSDLSFLRGYWSHEYTKIIVSTLPDEFDELNQNWKACYLCETRLIQGNVPRIVVPCDISSLVSASKTQQLTSLDESSRRQMKEFVKCLFEKRGRSLTRVQYDHLIQSIQRESSMLYIQIALEIVERWKSSEVSIILAANLPNIIHQLFEELELAYGLHLVSGAAQFINYGRKGLNDLEIEDLLSLTEDVIKEVQRTYELSVDNQRVPSFVWLGLKRRLRAFLTEQRDDSQLLFTWKYSCFREVLQRRYYHTEESTHQLMGKYYGNCFPSEIVESKRIALNMRTLSGERVWFIEDSRSLLNYRRCIEAAHHLVQGRMYSEAVYELCCFENICIAVLSRQSDEYLEIMAELITAYPRYSSANTESRQGDPPYYHNPSDLFNRLTHYFIWIRKNIKRLQLNPKQNIPLTASAEPMVSLVRKEIANYLSWLLAAATEEEETNYYRWLPARALASERYFYNMIMLLMHNQEVTSQFAIGVSQSLSASNSLSLYQNKPSTFAHSVCESFSANKASNLSPGNGVAVGFSTPVTLIAWHPTQNKMVSCYGNEMKMWDVLRGRLRDTYQVDSVTSASFLSVSWYHDGRKILTCCGRFIKVWDAMSGEVKRPISSFQYDFQFVAWNVSHNLAAAVEKFNKDIYIFHLMTGELERIIPVREEILCIAWSNDGHYLTYCTQREKRGKIVYRTTVTPYFDTFEFSIHASESSSSSSSSHSPTKRDSSSPIRNSPNAENKTRNYTLTFPVPLSVCTMSWNYENTQLLLLHPQEAAGTVNGCSIYDISNRRNHSVQLDGSNPAISKSSLICTASFSPYEHTKKFLVMSLLQPVSLNHLIHIYDSSEIVFKDSRGYLPSITYALKLVLDEHKDLAIHVAWHPFQHKLASMSEDGQIKVWDISKASEEDGQGDKRAASQAAAVATRFLDETEIDVNQLHDLATMKFQCIAGNSSQTLAVTASDQVLSVWDLSTYQLLHRMKAVEVGIITSLLWHPHGRHFITAGIEESTVKLWDAELGLLIEEFSTMMPANSEVATLLPLEKAESLDSKNGEVEENALTTGLPNQPPPPPAEKGIVAVAWSDEGHQLISCNVESQLHIWSLPSLPLTQTMSMFSLQLPIYELRLNPAVTQYEQILHIEEYHPESTTGANSTIPVKSTSPATETPSSARFLYLLSDLAMVYVWDIEKQRNIQRLKIDGFDSNNPSASIRRQNIDYLSCWQLSHRQRFAISDGFTIIVWEDHKFYRRIYSSLSSIPSSATVRSTAGSFSSSPGRSPGLFNRSLSGNFPSMPQNSFLSSSALHATNETAVPVQTITTMSFAEKQIDLLLIGGKDGHIVVWNMKEQRVVQLFEVGWEVRKIEVKIPLSPLSLVPTILGNGRKFEGYETNDWSQKNDDYSHRPLSASNRFTSVLQHAARASASASEEKEGWYIYGVWKDLLTVTHHRSSDEKELSL